MANLTLIDWAKRLDPDGTVPILADLLSQTNQILEDAVYVQGNLPTGHRVTITTGLPTVYFRALNSGIPTSRGTTAQVDEACAIIESRSEVDIDLAMLNGNTAEFRLSEARLFIEAMNQTCATTLFYGNVVSDPKQFMGLSARYGSLSTPNAQNIISLAEGSPTALSQTSIWLICWGDQTVFCPFPKGSKAGLLQEDLGRQTSYDTGTTGQRMEVFAERFQWKTGLVVKDWRYAVRICNIEATAAGIGSLAGNQAPTSFKNILHGMTRAIARIPNPSLGRMAFYMNRTVFSALMRIALEKSNAALSVQAAIDQFGRPSQMLSFLGVQIRQVDAILNTEAVVT